MRDPWFLLTMPAYVLSPMRGNTGVWPLKCQQQVSLVALEEMNSNIPDNGKSEA